MCGVVYDNLETRTMGNSLKQERQSPLYSQHCKTRKFNRQKHGK